MTTIVSRLDLTQIFCDVDDFYQRFELSPRRTIQKFQTKPGSLRRMLEVIMKRDF